MLKAHLITKIRRQSLHVIVACPGFTARNAEQKSHRCVRLDIIVPLVPPYSSLVLQAITAPQVKEIQFYALVAITVKEDPTNTLNVHLVLIVEQEARNQLLVPLDIMDQVQLTTMTWPVLATLVAEVFTRWLKNQTNARIAQQALCALVQLAQSILFPSNKTMVIPVHKDTTAQQVRISPNNAPLATTQSTKEPSL